MRLRDVVRPSNIDILGSVQDVAGKPNPLKTTTIYASKAAKYI